MYTRSRYVLALPHCHNRRPLIVTAPPPPCCSHQTRYKAFLPTYFDTNFNVNNGCFRSSEDLGIKTAKIYFRLIYESLFRKAFESSPSNAGYRAIRWTEYKAEGTASSPTVRCYSRNVVTGSNLNKAICGWNHWKRL